ncbi:hypothetical protein DPEC_G00319870 [Dallia pectoralis]|uniref:Uncharacterized protein n=1 Tax=Dallia pectoralis TaxID=75939 RepID=A0ACC2F9N3_DALPE|nr:hypothetical protein DPEC_G00319870 [Dallia pectoralis]
MSEIRNQSGPSSEYVWKYEYYDYDEPVSFEGLKAHRYSIVIGFWVGLAVFVIFMFFVLTLLTKTGAPHQEKYTDNIRDEEDQEEEEEISSELCEKRPRLGNCVVDIRCPQGDSQGTEDKAFSRPLLDESRSFFHFYISEEEQGGGFHGAREGGGGGGGCRGGSQRARGRLGGDSSIGLDEMGALKKAEEMGGGSIDPQGRRPDGGTADRDNHFLGHHFDIPNFVNSEHSSMLGDDDLLLCEPPVFLDNQSSGKDSRHIVS